MTLFYPLLRALIAFLILTILMFGSIGCFALMIQLLYTLFH